MIKNLLIIPIIIILVLTGCTPDFDKFEKAMDNPEEFKTLVENIKNIDAQNKYGETLLMLAMGDNKPEAVGILLDMGADPKILDSTHRSGLEWAIYYNSNAAIKALFKKRPDLFNDEDFFGSSITYALEIGQYDILKTFLDLGLSPDATISTGKTLLQYAVQYAYQNYEVIQLLIDSGADINVQDKNGRTLLFTIQDDGEMRAITALVDAGIDMNIKDVSGHNVMFYWSMNNRLWLVKTLLEYGAIPEPGMFVIKTIERSYTDTNRERVQHSPGSVDYRIHGSSSTELVTTTTNFTEDQKIPIVEYSKTAFPSLYDLLIEIGYSDE